MQNKYRKKLIENSIPLAPIRLERNILYKKPNILLKKTSYGENNSAFNNWIFVKHSVLPETHLYKIFKKTGIMQKQ